VPSRPDELEDELDPDLVADGIEDDDLDEEDVLAGGFVVEGEDIEDAEDDIEDTEDAVVGSSVDPIAETAAEEIDDDFADEPALAVVASPEDDEEDIPVKRSGEFICTRCYLVKNNSQLANRKQKFCRDCA
jgi:hypothetical protein